MKSLLHLASALLLCGNLFAAEITLKSPLDYQVVQRASRAEGSIPIRVIVKDAGASAVTLEARLGTGEKWTPLLATNESGGLTASMKAPAGGWHRMEVRALQEGKEIAKAAVEHVGVGEVFEIGRAHV